MMQYLSILAWMAMLLPAIVAAEDSTAVERLPEADVVRSQPPLAKPGMAARTLIITPEREAAAITFVRHHHPELVELLTHLKESSPREYERAIRELFRTSERLALVQERDSEAYDLELGLWKARSRAQLLAARLQMADDPALRNELRSALEAEYDLRIRVLRHDRERLSQRVRGLEEQIERLGTRREAAIESQFQSLTRPPGKAALKAKGAKKAARSPASPPS
jgi:hypothetical protein